MLSRDKILRETSPLGIFFVKSGSGGNRLLFRYPYDDSYRYDRDLLSLQDDSDPVVSEKVRLQFQTVISESDEALCNMFSVNPNLCGQKFEIKISSVRHVGHPMSLLCSTTPFSLTSDTNFNLTKDEIRSQQHSRTPAQRVNLNLSSFDRLTAPNRNNNTNRGDITSFNIVCALRSSASYDIVDCYHDLSKRLAVALSFEERRDSYLSNEIKTILGALEENDIAKLSNSDNENCNSGPNGINLDVGAGQPKVLVGPKGDGTLLNGTETSSQSIFSTILERSNLARDLKRVFVCLSTSGIVDLKINNFVRVSFCLPQRVHRLKLLTHKSMPAIGNEDIKQCLIALRPYHGLLLLQEPQELLNSLPIDASPAFIQLIKVTKPDKNFMELSVDANLTLMQIFHIVSQLIYWAKATIIYPICDSNIYAIHPLASTGINSKLVSDFKTRFPSNKSLHHYLADFSEGISLSQLNGPLLGLEEKSNLLNIVTWLLQRRILTQIHKYIFLLVDKEPSADSTASSLTNKLQQQSKQEAVSNDISNSSPQGIVINVTNNINSNNNNTSGNISYANNTINANNNSRQMGPELRGMRISSIPSNSFESSPRMMKNSLTESVDSSLRRYRTDSLPESQEDSNFGLNSSLSSTPNSNFEYISPGNETRLSFSSSCPLDGDSASMRLTAGETVMATLQRAGLSQAGAKHVLSVPSSRNSDDLRLLLRLMPYFTGKHHVEDIMFLENLERSQVLILCDKFRDILFTSHYEDVAVSQLCPFTSLR